MCFRLIFASHPNCAIFDEPWNLWLATQKKITSAMACKVYLIIYHDAESLLGSAYCAGGSLLYRSCAPPLPVFSGRNAILCV